MKNIGIDVLWKEGSWNLRHIINWKQLKIELPNVQRGFVWKPSQIENLWDSLLRGYPIGAFVLSVKRDEESVSLLDGQQRATAICLGFGTETFRQSHSAIKVFIDLAAPPPGDTRKFIIRTITKSHPWGYQRNDNSETLESGKIREAMRFFDIRDNLNVDLDVVAPYDAIFPVPLNYFLEIAGRDATVDSAVEELIERLTKHWTDPWQRILKRLEESKSELLSPDLYKGRMAEIFRCIRKMLDEQRVPLLTLDLDSLTETTQSKPISSASNQLQVEDEDSGDEIENLFIRLNAGGTPIKGEELNYSVLKASIDDRDLQNKIEVACEKGLFNPARFITIAYRLFQNQPQTANSVSQKESLSIRIKTKQFKNLTKNKTDFDAFRDFLGGLLVGNDYGGIPLLEYTRMLLEHSDANHYGLPHLLVARMSDTAPEIVLMLLFRLQVKQDRFKLGSEQHRRMLGLVSIFLWFGKPDNQKTYSRLLSNIWLGAKTLELDNYWSAETMQRALLDDDLTRVPTFRQLRLAVNGLVAQANTNIERKIANLGDEMESFIVRTFKQRDLVLYAQRKILSNWFPAADAYHLDDTNVPFDWDHISPYKLIKGRKNIPRAVKYFYNSNGNFRAWPYSLNRMDQGDSPARKLDPLNPVHFQQGASDTKLKEIEKEWADYLKNMKSDIKDPKQLHKLLLDWSVCESGWKKCNHVDLKKDWQIVFNLIKTRNLKIIHKWYDALLIDKLIPPSKPQDLFGLYLNKSKWEKGKSSDERTWWCSKPRQIAGESVYWCFGYHKPSKYDSLSLLIEGSIWFGIYDLAIGNKVLKKVQIPDFGYPNYHKADDGIGGNFTLVSCEQQSYLRLFSCFEKWLRRFPDEEIRALAEQFAGSLVVGAQSMLEQHK